MQYASLAAAGNLLGLRPFGSLAALAQTSPGYKALVCIFLYGGNDANNMLIPAASTDYANYASLRGPLAIPQGSLLHLNGQPSLALNPNMPHLQAAFNNGSAALLANVGTLVQPLTKAQYQAGTATLPENLFSHNDQQVLWQNGDGVSSTTTGWAGRMSDLLGATSGGTLPMVMSVAGAQIFCSGNQSQPVVVTPGSSSAVGCNQLPAACSARLASAQQLLSFDTGVKLIQADETITSNAYTYSATLAQALASAPRLSTVFPGGGSGSLGAQLQQIAQIISVRSAVGASRQIFFALLGGFDTHSSEASTHNALLGQLDAGLLAFNQSMTELNLANQVTTFTMSDFNRVLQPNTAGGSDHAWGSHHLITGGAVKGGQVYGTFPTLALGGPDDAIGNGSWLPTTSNSQYANTLATWFGVPAAQMSTVLPCLANFPTQSLGFV